MRQLRRLSSQTPIHRILDGLTKNGKLPVKVTITECGARDGLQMEKTFVKSEDKITFINMLSDSGLTAIEATSFVNPKLVPQLADAETVFKGINKKEGLSLPVIAFSMNGYERAVKSGAQIVGVFATTSNAFSEKNVAKTATQSESIARDITLRARSEGLQVRAYLGCTIGCPYSGPTSPVEVANLCQRMIANGCYEICLGDTNGIGTPATTASLVDAVLSVCSPDQISVHSHDTYGQSLANILTSLSLGVTKVDSSVHGLGGCPFAVGATGNVATEDLVYMLHGIGIETGIDMDKLITAGQFILPKLGKECASRAANAIMATKRRELNP